MAFLKESNMEGLKSVFLNFLYMDIDNDNDFYPMIVNHPIFESGFSQAWDKETGDVEMINITESTENLNKARESVKRVIMSTFDNPLSVVMAVRKPYKLTFLKYTKDYLSKKDFSEILGDVWVSIENGNHDINVSVPIITKWFKEAHKGFLMSKDEREYIKNLPEEIKVYRGVGKGRNPKGLSWTDDEEVAKWFAERFDTDEGYVLEGMIYKSDVLAYFDRSAVKGISESELVISYNSVRDLKKYKP